jgi:hypothetical protein
MVGSGSSAPGGTATPPSGSVGELVLLEVATVLPPSSLARPRVTPVLVTIQAASTPRSSTLNSPDARIALGRLKEMRFPPKRALPATRFLAKVARRVAPFRPVSSATPSSTTPVSQRPVSVPLQM